MRPFRTMLSLVILALWVPVTGHCLWENAFTVESAACGEHANPVESGRDCCASNCNALENGFLKSNPQTGHDPSAVELGERIVVLPPPERATGSGAAIAAGPPELTPRWQFLLRTALPVRAPSFVS